MDGTAEYIAFAELQPKIKEYTGFLKPKVLPNLAHLLLTEINHKYSISSFALRDLDQFTRRLF